MRFFADHPILIGLPIALGAALLAQSLVENAGLSALVGSALFVFLQLLAVRLQRVRDRADLSKRLGAATKRLDGLEGVVTAIQSELQAIASRAEESADKRNQRLVREMQMIEGLVAQLALGSKTAPAAPNTDDASSAQAATAEPLAEREPTARAIASLSEPELLEVIQSALEDNRIDLYLQPIAALPSRKVKHYEGLARLRSLDGEVIEPAQYEGIAIAEGFMPIIDNLLLFRCVQIVRRLASKNLKRGIFCAISPHSLIDADFFPQFLEFMRENAALKELLVFELARGTLDLAGTEGEANLDALAKLGFTFALGSGEDLKMDLAWLRRRGFRFVKLPASLFVATQHEPETQIAIDNFLTRLERQGIELIIDGIDTEEMILPVLEHAAALGQGLLFGGARPIRRDLLEGTEESEAPRQRRRASQC